MNHDFSRVAVSFHICASSGDCECKTHAMRLQRANLLLMDIPYQQLQPETLRALIEEFVTRSGTDYGAREASLEAKVEQVLRQLETSKAQIVFDAELRELRYTRGCGTSFASTSLSGFVDQVNAR